MNHVSTLADTVSGRRVTWVGTAIHDLMPGSQTHGEYFRVAVSERDPETDAWGIYWRIVEDRLPGRPEGEPTYKFDGTTWDMPAYAMTVVPWGTMIFSGLLLFGGMIGAGNEVGSAGAFMWFVAWVIAGTPWLYAAWMYKIEPVRGTRIMAAVAAWSQYRKHENRLAAERIHHESMTMPWQPPSPPQAALQQATQPEAEWLLRTSLDVRKRGFTQETIWHPEGKPAGLITTHQAERFGFDAQGRCHVW